MRDKDIMLTVIAMIVVIVPASLALALWLIGRLRRKSDAPLSRDATGVTVVPVRQLMRTFGFGGRSRNGINPRLELAPDGVRFTVFKPDRWAFDDIVQVHAPRALFATRLAMRNRSGAFLYVDLADAARARDLLRALPPRLPFTPRAIALRDGPAPG